MILINLKLDFPFTDFSQHFVIYIGGHCTQVFYSLAHGVRGKLAVICVVNQVINMIQLQPKYKTRNFQNLIRKRFLRDIH